MSDKDCDAILEEAIRKMKAEGADDQDVLDAMKRARDEIEYRNWGWD